VGVVGPLNSNVCQAEAPFANNADLVQISPSCAASGLTQPGSDPATDTLALRPTGKVTFFRVCTTDVNQSAALAMEAVSLGAKKAFVFDDQEADGQGLAEHFSKDFASDGGSVVGSASMAGTTTDFTTPLQQAASKGADIVFFGGTSSDGGGKLRAQMSPAGLSSDVHFMGGGGIVDSTFTGDAGAAANDAYAVVAAPDVTKVPAAASFISSYTSAYNSAPGVYSASAYDAMNIILTAAAEAIMANGGALPQNAEAFRESIHANVAAISYPGVIGTTTFDADGDTNNKVLTLFQVRGGSWASIASLHLVAQAG
ncbi:MAG: branched-chain amino acid ABC transporter substrate-binding protein, partial [Candidatus Dormibacteraeota bacterium]|nr:branched-chain amino acid ABC transporter substrate-binding protein [Candidatus Dormibacteraeota bacterium]